MKKFIWGLIGFWSFAAFAIPCDCEVRAHTPLTASQKVEPFVLSTYPLEEFSSYHPKNIQSCRNSCLAEFEKDMPATRLNALLVTYGQQLIDRKDLGYNCTGLTTMKFPVRVRAKLGGKGLGNVADLVQVVTHEQVCF